MSRERPAFARLRRGHARVRTMRANDGGRGATGAPQANGVERVEGAPATKKC